MTFQEDQKYFLEMNTEEINVLKEELQFHEEVVTNMLEEDRELKDKIQQLEKENKMLKNLQV